jgi:general secretion pathway protein D
VRALSALLLVGFACLLAGCNHTDSVPSGNGAGILGDNPPFLNPFKALAGAGLNASDGSPRPRGYLDPGLRAGDAPRTGDDGPRPALSPQDGVSFNFVNADVQEFARIAFDEILKEPVVIDPQIQGAITIRTPQPVARKVAMDLVRSALETQGLSLSRDGQAWRISGRGQAPGRGEGAGNVRHVPLSSIGAEQARAALQPFASQQVRIAAGPDGRSLLISGPQADVDGLAQVIGALDVDQMRAISFALLPLKDAGAQAVAQELNQMFGARDPQGFRAMPIQRINGILITARSRETLSRARSWVQKLDQTGRDTRRVQVYQLQNRRAQDVAQILQGMFGQGTQSQTPQPRPGSTRPVSPGLTPALSQSFNLTGMAPGSQPPGNAQTASLSSPAQGPATETTTGGYADPPVAPQLSLPGQDPEQSGPVHIRPDIATNSIVVIAKPDEYRTVESAIRRLDVLPSQVLIEATIVEVGLNDALRHGVRWFLQSGNHSGSLTDSPVGSQSSVYPGFNYTFSAGNARLVVHALERITDIEIVSSPALTVLDNQAATLKIGDQVPVATRSARSVTNPDAPIVNDIEMKDTGIILSVTPRVNASGLVMLDISQEASDVVPTTSSTIDSPTIRQRKINSSVAVQSGHDVILGGIISRKREKTKQGVPGLMHLPIVGGAFTSLATRDKERTELMIIIRPTVVNSRQDLQILTEEIKSRMAASRAALYR